MKQMHTPRCRRNRLFVSAATGIALALSASPVLAQQGTPTQVELRAQSLGDALLQIGNTYGVTVIAPDTLVRGKTAPRISDSLTAEQAVARVLRGSGLTYRRTRNGGFVVAQQTAQAEPVRPPPRANVEERPEPEEPMMADTIVVTGTNIRGLAPESSPTLQFNREDIIATGAPTAQDFIRTIPQISGAGSNGFSGQLPNDNNSAFNVSFGSPVNLRGLGPSATLVLLNGRRVPRSSGVAEFVDISLFPGSALERVDVVLDGASSIYGSDAVAGVANFILRDDLDGIETSVRYGTVTEGDFDQVRASAAAGTTWSTGNVMVAYEYFDQDFLSAEDRDFAADSILPNFLVPAQERHSVVVSGRQELGSNVTLSGDFLFGSRDNEQSQTDFTGLFESISTTDLFSIGGGLVWDIDSSWTVELTGTYGVTTIDNARDSDLLGPQQQDISSELYTVGVNLSGPLLSLPGGDLRFATGGQFRGEDFDNVDISFDESGMSVSELSAALNRDIWSAYGELFVPVFGLDNRRPGLERLELNVSVRAEDYSDFGTTVDPKVAVLWQPVEGFRLRGSWGTSFNAPILGRAGATDSFAFPAPTSLINQLFGFESAGPEVDDIVALFLRGTAPGLVAETAETWSVGAQYEQSWGAHSVNLSVDRYDISFENRLGFLPIPGSVSPFNSINVAFSNPELLPPGTVIFNPSLQQVEDALASVAQGVTNFFFDPFIPADVSAISFAPLFDNNAITEVEGVDINANYHLDAGHGVFNAGVNIAVITKFDQSGSSTVPAVDISNTLFNPLDLTLRGNLGYSNDNLSVNVFSNYANAYRESSDPNSERIEDWLTFDVSVVYDFSSGRDRGMLSGLSLGLFVTNVFDDAPPLTPLPSGIFPNITRYDPANASPIQRFIAFEVTKRF
ncbi:MAG: TonB-dependent receptor [Pseudomonadota bacterium]